MKAKWWRNEFKVGLMTIIGLTLLFILLMKASDWRFTGVGNKVKIHFDSVGGLLKNAPIHMHGVEVGRVTKVKLLGDKVEVTATLNTDTPIREGYMIFIDTLGLVGERYIEISNGPATNPPTQDDPLKGTGPVNIGRILMQADEVTGKTIETIDSVRGLVDTNKEDVHAGIVELRSFVQEAKNTLKETKENVDVFIAQVSKLAESAEGDMSRIMADAGKLVDGLNSDRNKIVSLIQDATDKLDHLITHSTPSVEESVDNLQMVSRDLRTTMKEVSNQVNEFNRSASQLMDQLNGIASSSDQKLQKGLDDFNNSVSTLKELAVKVNGMVSEIEEGKGTLGKFIKEEESYNQINEAVAASKAAMEDFSGLTKDVRKITDGLNSNLHTISTIKTRKEFGLSYNNQEQALQSQFALKLSSSSPYVYMAGVTVRDKPVYDLQIGRKFGGLMARAGAIRSKSGIGLDYWTFGGRLCTTLEVVDVAEKEAKLDMDFAVKFADSWYFLFGARDLARSGRGITVGIRAISGN